MASSGMNVGFMASFKSLTLTLTHAPTEEKEAEEEFYSSLDKVCDAVPKYDMKTTQEDFNHKGGKRFLFVSSMWRTQPSQRII
jgi:hypothetical protein